MILGILLALGVLGLVVVWAVKCEVPRLNTEGARLTNIERKQKRQHEWLDEIKQLQQEGRHVEASASLAEYQRFARSVNAQVWEK